MERFDSRVGFAVFVFGRSLSFFLSSLFLYRKIEEEKKRYTIFTTIAFALKLKRYINYKPLI